MELPVDEQVGESFAEMRYLEKSIGPAILMKFFTEISGCEAMNDADSGAPMQ